MSATDFKEVSYPLRVKNFNADPKREFVRERELLYEVLLQAW